MRLLGSRNFRLFWLGQTGSQIGDWLLRIALPLYVFGRTGSTLSTGITFLASTVPAVVLAPIAGALVDRWRPRGTMISADIGRALILLVLLFEPGRGAIWVVYICATGQACLSQFFAPARTALLPSLVSEDALAKANSAISAGSEVALLGGPALGGLIYATAGLRLAVGLDIASYLLSAVTLGALSGNRADVSSCAVATDRDRDGLFRQFRSGTRVIRRDPILRALFPASFVLFVGGGLLPVVIVPFLRDTLHATGTEYGLVLSAQALGGLLGAAVASRLIRDAGALRVPIAVSLLSMAAAVTFLALMTRWWAAALCLAMGGIPTTISAVAASVILQAVPDPDHRGRVAGLYSAVVAAGVAIGAPLASLLVDAVGPADGVAVSAGFFAGSGLIALFRLPRWSSPPI
jgi:predicted MFS family arabinose efflux permease